MKTTTAGMGTKTKRRVTYQQLLQRSPNNQYTPTSQVCTMLGHQQPHNVFAFILFFCLLSISFFVILGWILSNCRIVRKYTYIRQISDDIHVRTMIQIKCDLYRI